MNNRVRTYLDPLNPVEVNIRDQFVSENSYKELVQKTVISCTDVILTIADNKAIYLAKRSVYPMKGIWCFGGRIFFNDKSLEDSVARCLEIETGVRLAPDRFVYVWTNLYSWVKVAQGNFSGRNLAATYVCEVSQEELATMTQGISKKEYDRDFGIQRFDHDRLHDEKVHQAMIDVYEERFK